MIRFFDLWFEVSDLNNICEPIIKYYEISYISIDFYINKEPITKSATKNITINSGFIFVDLLSFHMYDVERAFIVLRNCYPCVSSFRFLRRWESNVSNPIQPISHWDRLSSAAPYSPSLPITIHLVDSSSRYR